MFANRVSPPAESLTLFCAILRKWLIFERATVFYQGIERDLRECMEILIFNGTFNKNQ